MAPPSCPFRASAEVIVHWPSSDLHLLHLRLCDGRFAASLMNPSQRFSFRRILSIKEYLLSWRGGGAGGGGGEGAGGGGGAGWGGGGGATLFKLFLVLTFGRRTSKTWDDYFPSGVFVWAWPVCDSAPLTPAVCTPAHSSLLCISMLRMKWPALRSSVPDVHAANKSVFVLLLRGLSLSLSLLLSAPSGGPDLKCLGYGSPERPLCTQYHVLMSNCYGWTDR